jgi:hypothetical protein
MSYQRLRPGSVYSGLPERQGAILTAAAQLANFSSISPGLGEGIYHRGRPKGQRGRDVLCTGALAQWPKSALQSRDMSPPSA